MRKFEFLDLKKLHASIDPEIRAAMDGVLGHGKFIMGPEVGQFDCDWAGYCQTTDAIGCANGTAALHTILQVMGIGPGDEVVVPSNTFIATAESVRLTGARPVFCEADEATLLIDARAAEFLITPRTRAIVAVHLYGTPADMDALLAAGARHGIPVVEDASQAHGGLYRGRKAGSLGIAAAFSFFPGKNLGAFGDAGGITTSDAGLGAACRLYVNHGRRDKYEHLSMGTNYRLDTLQAAILLAKLPHLDKWIATRRKLARAYREILLGEPFASHAVRVPDVTDGSESAYHLFTIQTEGRDAIQAALGKRGVSTGVHYPIPCHLQPSMADVQPAMPGSLPVTERAAETILSLPICPTMATSDVEAICDILKSVLAGGK